jgi:uncharacterized membrane protein
MRVGYAAVFSEEDPLDEQQDFLIQAGCEKVFTDVITGANEEKKGLRDALVSMGKGNTLVVWKLDRLSRSQKRLIEIITLLHEKQCGLLSLTENLDIASDDGKLIVNNVSALAEFPRNIKREITATKQEDKNSQKASRVLFGGITFVFIVIFYFICFSLPSYDNYTGRVTHVHENSRDVVAATVDETVTVLVTSGNLNGKEYTMDYKYSYILKNNEANTGDNVLLNYDARTKQMFINGYDRRGLMFLLISIFFLLTVLIARRQGIMSIIGMLVSILVIMIFVVPNILQGRDPLLFAILSAFVIIPTTYYLAHGWNKKTTVAIIATFITLAMTFLLASLFTHLMNIPDAVSDVEMQGYYTEQGALLDLQSFYLAALVIGSLAVLNDITISQASIVTSLVKSNPSLSFNEIFMHAMNVGKDHIASLINTLLLVYIGASFPLFLTFVANHYDISNPILAVEIVRIIVPSIGIVAAVPISTAIAAYLASHKRRLWPHISLKLWHL